MGIPDGCYRRLSPALSGASPVTFAQADYASRTRARYDMHYGLELGVVLSGRMRRFYRDGERDVGAGDAWLCGMWEPHGFEVRTRCRCAVFVIWPPFLGRLRLAEDPGRDWLLPFRVEPMARPCVPAERRKGLVALVESAAARMGPAGPARRVQLQLLALEALLEVTAAWDAPGRASLTPREAGGWLARAVDLAHERRAGVSVQEAARCCAMGRNRFSREFQAAMGIRFRDFSLRCRLSGAADRLLNSDLPIKAIVDEWGFTDHSHLLRLFRQHYGATPAQYRRRFREGGAAPGGVG